MKAAWLTINKDDGASMKQSHETVSSGSGRGWW